MKARSLLTMTALVFGMLAASSASAGNAIIKITHSSTPYRGGYNSAPATVAKKAQPTVAKGKSEVQIAVLANMGLQPAPRRSVFIHR